MTADETPTVFDWRGRGAFPDWPASVVEHRNPDEAPLPKMPLRVAARRPQLPTRDVAAETARRALRYGRFSVVMATLAMLMGATALAFVASQAGRGVQRVLVGTQSCVTVPADSGQQELFCRSDALPR